MNKPCRILVLMELQMVSKVNLQSECFLAEFTPVLFHVGAGGLLGLPGVSYHVHFKQVLTREVLAANTALKWGLCSVASLVLVALFLGMESLLAVLTEESNISSFLEQP